MRSGRRKRIRDRERLSLSGCKRRSFSARRLIIKRLRKSVILGGSLDKRPNSSGFDRLRMRREQLRRDDRRISVKRRRCCIVGICPACRIGSNSYDKRRCQRCSVKHRGYIESCRRRCILRTPCRAAVYTDASRISGEVAVRSR